MKSFYIFRHGETDMNKQGFVQGQSHNPSLNSTGIEQAKDLVPSLINKNLEVIFSSPLNRAFETASIVANAMNLPIIKTENFAECWFGDIEGVKKEQALLMFDEAYKNWDKENAGFPNGESRKNLDARLISKLEEIANSSPYQNIGIATHGGVIREIGLYYNHPIGVINNGAILHMEYKKDFKIIEII